MPDNQLIIDAELYNPKVNNKDLLTGGRINPEIGIARQDIIEGDNVTIEQMSDGRLKISANVPDSGVSYTIFSEAQKLDFLKNLPPKEFCYLSTLFSGISISMTKMTWYYVNRLQENRKDAPEAYVYDINGDIHFTPPDESLGQIDVTMELKDNSYDKGQGGLFTIDTDIERPYYTVQIATDAAFSNVIIDKTGTSKSFFISFNNLTSGDYYWRVKIIDISTLQSSSWTTGNFTFTYEAPPYADVACPSNLTSNTSDPNWAFSVVGWNRSLNDVWQLFSANGFGEDAYESYFQDGETSYVAWSRTDSKKLLAQSGCKFNFEPNGPGSPRKVWIEGSEDGSSWETIFYQENENQYQSNPYTFSFSNSVAYTYLRARFDNSYQGYGSYVNKIEVY